MDASVQCWHDSPLKFAMSRTVWPIRLGVGRLAVEIIDRVIRGTRNPQGDKQKKLTLSQHAKLLATLPTQF